MIIIKNNNDFPTPPPRPPSGPPPGLPPGPPASLPFLPDDSFLNLSSQPLSPLLSPQNSTDRVSENIPAALQEVDRLLEKVKFKPRKIEVDDTTGLTLNKAPAILKETFLRDKELQKKSIDEIKEEYNFDEILESLKKGETSDSIKHYFGGENENFFMKCKLLNLSIESENSVDFLSSDYHSRIMRENKLLMRIERGNVFFDNFNTNGCCSTML